MIGGHYMEDTYKTPLAKIARFLEIFIPGYMFGKAWGIAHESTVDLYRAMFPPVLINIAESMKKIIDTDSHAMELLFSTMSGAVIGFIVIMVLGLVMHFVLNDRRYVDSLRFTSITLIPLAVMNGTLSHVSNTVLDSLGGGESAEALTNSALQSPRGQIALFCVLYVISIWMFGKRTGVKGWRRYGVLVVGIGFMAAYFLFGLSITTSEWTVLLPKLQAAMASH
jgi:hypothetical protein